MDNSSYYASIYSDSPSLRSSTSRYVNSRVGLGSSFLNSTYATVNETMANETFDATMVEETEPFLVLFKQFQEAKLKFPENDDAFEFVQELENICSDHLSVLNSLKQKKTNLGADDMFSRQIDSWLRLEKNSWSLLRILYEDRLKSSGNEDSMVLDSPEPTAMSDKEVVDEFYDKNDTLRQMQLVVDWVEQNEWEILDAGEYKDRIEFYSEGPHYWENCLHDLKNKRNSKKTSHVLNERSMCPEMDPDAPLRTKRNIHDLDKEDENRILKHIFKYLRAGRLNVGKEIAQKIGYHWLAAALDGWMLQNDPNCGKNDIDSSSVKNVEGNANRDLWKYTCWCSSKITSDAHSIYERAVFGALSANLAVTLPLLPTWSDKVWAYFRASIDVQIERELRETTTLKSVSSKNSNTINSSIRSLVSLPEEYWNNFRTTEEIFREVEANLDLLNISTEERCHQNIQKYMILNDTNAMAQIMIDYIRNEITTKKIYPQMLRFFAHVVLFLKYIGLWSCESPNEIFSTILDAYIIYLIQEKEITQVAWYVSELPSNLQVTSYTKLLETVTDANKRKLCLKLAEQAKLDTQSIAKSVVETIRQYPSKIEKQEIDSTRELSFKTNSEDSKKIEALDWLFLNNIQYSELLHQGNALMRYFILSSKVDAAKESFRKLPVDIIDGVLNSMNKKRKLSNLPIDISNSCREYLCHKAYFQAVEAFDEWVRFYHHSKPSEPQKPNSTRFTDKVSYEHLNRQYESELEQWKQLLVKQAKLTADKIYNVLVFPDGGWMADQEEEDIKMSTDAKYDERQQEMENLRKKIIPQLTFILHSVLHSSNRLKDCLQIADVIASQQYNLYKYFDREQLQNLLRKMRETSISCLDENSDSFGYHIEKV